jgi:hypothetical protein
MSRSDLTPAPDWFDRLWDQNSQKIPVYLRNDAFKKTARGLVGLCVESLGSFAKTPDGMRQVVAYARIVAALRGVQGVANAPDPSPEQVAEMVERLVARVKP